MRNAGREDQQSDGLIKSVGQLAISGRRWLGTASNGETWRKPVTDLGQVNTTHNERITIGNTRNVC